MRRLFLACCWLLSAWLLGCLAAPAAASITLSDDLQRTLHFEMPPQRIISLLPSLTESLCALRHCGRLVATDRYSNWPASVQHLPKVGGGLDPHIEAIVALRPDVVLLPLKSRAVHRLESLGIRAVALDAKTHADVRRVLRLLGDLLALPHAQGADPVWSGIEAAMEAAAQTLAQGARGKRVYFETSRGPWVAGPGSFIGETLTRLGLVNVVPAKLGPFARINPEFVFGPDARADVIMLVNPESAPAQLYPGWHQLPPVQKGHVCIFRGTQADVLLRPGPRIAEAARILAQCLNELYA